ncbi:MAG: pyrroloquinoline quinone biosynthesis peptide chaperone PqqD [Chitinophagaceae bacterium]|nr:pyrroloquinoline quinone biosynthesis peptide chaperone PqqD [Oligoflexus sp.]
MELNVPLPHDAFIQMARPFRFQWEPAQDCFVILYPEGMVKLNQAAGLILNLCCKHNQSLAQTVESLAQDFGQEPQSIQDDVQEFLRIAHDNRWIELRQ